jgi:CubicO group peptidase (beta-lactamase class C family)
VTNHRDTFDDMQCFHAEWSLATWDKGGPLMRYTFRRMTEFFPHAVIRRAGTIATLNTAPRQDIADAAVQTANTTTSLDAYVQAGPVNGVVILHHGDIVYERYPRMNARDLHLTMSVSKVFTSTLIAILEDRGDLDSRNAVETYLPKVRGSGWEGVSVRDVLDMASGIDCDQTGPDVYTNAATPYYGFEASLGWLPPTPSTASSTYEYVARLGRLKEPGRSFDYSSANTFLLAWIAERVTGRPYADLLSDEIWSRIGAEGDAVISIVPASGATTVHAGLSARLRDIVRFGLLFTPSRHVVCDTPIISERYLHEIVSGGRPETFANGISGQATTSRMPDDPPLHNSYQWDYVMPDGDFYKGGYGGQGLYISPRRDLVIAFAGAFEAGGPASEMASIARQLALSGLFDH